VNKKERSTARNAVSRIVYAKRLPRSLAKEDKKKGPEERVNVFMKKVNRVYLLVSLHPKSSELPQILSPHSLKELLAEKKRMTLASADRLSLPSDRLSLSFFVYGFFYRQSDNCAVRRRCPLSPPSEPKALAERNPVGAAHFGPPLVEPDMPLAGRAQALEHDGPSPSLRIMNIHASASLHGWRIFTPRHAFHKNGIQDTFEFRE
jgi:hypothetical protein